MRRSRSAPTDGDDTLLDAVEPEALLDVAPVYT
jgi:hypothetical protein